jgi:hypothetical protein
MIISHVHKFIFIKTFKTAGTSVEIALSKYCGPDDVITPIIPEDEAKRRELGYPGPQNDLIPLSRYTFGDFARALQKRRRLHFTNHVGADFIQKYVDPEVWDSYFKFCFERNPWDRVISAYYFRNREEPRPGIAKFIDSGRANTFGGFELYTRDGTILVDRVFKFEQLESAMEELRERIGLPETPVLPRTKAGTRANKSGYRELLTPEQRDHIARVYAREIAYFGYEW